MLATFRWTGTRAAAVALALVAGAGTSVAAAGLPVGTEAAHASLLPRRSTGRVVIVVSTDLQKLTVYDDGVPVAHTTVSTGIPEHPTPHGVFSIIAKERFHRSNIYSDAPMPWMQRITWSGVALHEGHVTGRPASHGCIRMPPAFAFDLFRYTREGARVIVAREDVVPTPWGSLAALFPSATPASTEAAAPPGVSDGSAAIKPASSAMSDVEFTERPRFSATPAPAGRPDATARYPVSLLVSRKTGKLYVRRAFKPVFSVPIAIDEPNRPLGTHLFVAGADAARQWSALSLDAPVREASLLEAGTRPRRLHDAPAPLLPSSAGDALARLHVPPGTAALIGSLLSPGATLILSDDGARNRETWDGTDFIALSE